jgi:enediyne biosynthesis protein E4
MQKGLVYTICSWLFSTYAFAQTSQPLFTLLPARQTGINFVNSIRENEALNVLAYEYFYNGGGVAIGDINNDGLADIFLTANLKSCKLYLNKGDFQFTDITGRAGVSGRKDWKTGVTMADVNGDGWLDIYVSYSGKGSPVTRRNELYINNRDLSFSEKAIEYGLADEGCSTQAIFFDYDLDDDLDCYVLNHNIRAYRNIELHYLKTDYDSLAADRLYQNDHGRFVDISSKAGISGNPISFGLGVAVSDINSDGWPDIYVSNDYTEQDYCYINNRNGGFAAREQYMFSHLSQFSMGSDIADMNNDGLVDIITLDMLPPDNRRQKLLQAQDNYELYEDMAANGFHFQFMRNMLHLNNGNGTFSEVGQLAGVSNTDWSWAPLFADFDDDGYKDLFITTGYMRDYTNRDFLKYWGDYLVKQVVKRDSVNYLDIIKMMPVTLLPNFAFRNGSDLKFRNVSLEWGLDKPGLSNGAAFGDLDNDGDLDLVINNINEPAFVYRNDRSSDNHYISIKLKGQGKNKFGLGAKITCYSGGRMQFIEQMPTRGYQSSVTEILHFGLGRSEIVDSLHVRWLDGKTETIYQVMANQTIILDQANASLVPRPRLPITPFLFSRQKPAIGFSHVQLEYNDFKRQPLMPMMYSQCGPRLQAGDLDNDGMEDLFIGSSQGQPAEVYLQKEGGVFKILDIPALYPDSFSTTTDIAFLDADGDGDTDIYATSGGYADYSPEDRRLQDRLYLNNGKGDFSIGMGKLPVMTTSKSCLAASDLDGDGDTDLFIGGGVVPGEYPTASRSYLLINDGKGHFTDVTKEWNSGLVQPGLIKDACWVDFNNDKRPDLFLTGEWMAPKIYLNNGTTLDLFDAGLNLYKGWWNTMELFDMDHDGDMDMIAGNWGMNSQFSVNRDEPLELFFKDLDQNGSIDPLLSCYIQGVSYPFVTRDELLDQVYQMRRRFTSYESYANATIKDIILPGEMTDLNRLEVTQLATTLFENINGRFVVRSLPVESQYSPVYKILVIDCNKDRHPDLLLFGNNDHVRLRLGKMDSNFGTVLINDGRGNFRNARFQESGLVVPGDVKDATIIRQGPQQLLIIGINNGELVTYTLNH